MPIYDSYNDDELVALLKQDVLEAFMAIHNRYYALLYKHAYSRLPQPEEIKDILQEIFIYLWDHRATIEFSSSLSVYLYAAVRNKILNVFKHQKVKTAYIKSFQQFLERDTPLPDENIRTKQLAALIEAEIESLPTQMRLIFQLSRNAQLSHRQIANELNISHLTVKKQINNSLRILRSKLRTHLNLFFF